MGTFGYRPPIKHRTPFAATRPFRLISVGGNGPRPGIDLDRPRSKRQATNSLTDGWRSPSHRLRVGCRWPDFARLGGQSIRHESRRPTTGRF